MTGRKSEMRVRTLGGMAEPLLEQRQHPGDGTDKSQLLGDELMPRAAIRARAPSCARYHSIVWGNPPAVR